MRKKSQDELRAVAAVRVVATPVTSLPAALEAAIGDMPPRLTRRDAATFLQRHVGLRVSARSLERWPLASRVIAGRAMIETRALAEFAQRLVDDAPVLAGGSREPGVRRAA